MASARTTVPLEVNSFSMLTLLPGLRNAARQRSSAHCVPISTAIEVRTPSALFSRLSFFVMSETRANPLNSLSNEVADEAAILEGAADCKTAGVEAAAWPAEDLGASPALALSCCNLGVRSSSCGDSC